jgi:hypothetical protein
MNEWNGSCDVADLVDGRLLSACLHNSSIGAIEAYHTLVQACGALGASFSSDETVGSNGPAGIHIPSFWVEF